MTSMLFRFLFFYVPFIVLEQLGYISNIWWIFIGIPIAEYLIFIWNRWRRTNTKITPEHILGGLTALLRIRSAEIGAIYHQVRSYQNKAKENAWIPLFMAEYRQLQNYSVYDDAPYDKKDRKYLKRAHALYTKRFSYNPFFGTLEEPVLMDTAAAIQCWSSGFDFTIRLLNSIQCDTSLSQHVCALLREYRLIQLLTLNGNYHILFKGWWPLSNLARESYCRLRQHWEEVVRSHQGAVIITKTSSIFQQDTSSLDELWAENEALRLMERNLRRAISQENCKSFGWTCDWENEHSFFQRLKTNPIWTQFHQEELYDSVYKESTPPNSESTC